MIKTQYIKQSLVSLSHVSNLHVKFNRKIPDCCYLLCIYTLENTKGDNPQKLATWDMQEEENQNMGNRAKTRSLLQLVWET